MRNLFFLMLAFDLVLSLDFPPRPPNAPKRHRNELGLSSSTYEVFNPIRNLHYQHSIQRRGSPYLLLRPLNLNKRPNTSRRLLLTLPKDNIQILNAEAVSERLSLRDTEKEFTPSRFHYGFLSESYEERNPKGEVSYEMDDLEGSSGAHVTLIKGHPAPPPNFLSARKLKGSRHSTMKAFIVQPKEIQAKRVGVRKNVSPSQGRFVKAGEAMLRTAVKAQVHPVSFTKATVSKSEDWAASNVQYVNAEPPRDQDGGFSSMADLQCGGSHDLGWCDLGNNYPSSEVSEIMEVCEDLLSRMYVEVPISSSSMEDIASYSLSRNVSHSTYWPWKESVATFKKSLCHVQKNAIQPSFAQDIRGKWHVIIQTQSLPQRVALEVCRNPGEPCIASELCRKSESQCVQKYSHHQLISFDPESAETCPYVRLYKFPTSCVCRIAE